MASRWPDHMLARIPVVDDSGAHVTQWVPVEASPASTVILLRERAGLEVLLMRRVPSMAFAAGMTVFPGGRLDQADLDAAGHDLAAALRLCAIREVAEETGVNLDLGHLRDWSHWITPEIEDRRYDVRFYVAPMPDQDVYEDPAMSGEADQMGWWTPGEALDEYHAGRLPMLTPTSHTLTELSNFDSLATVLAEPRSIRPWLPYAFREGDDVRWMIVDGYTREIIQRDRGLPSRPESQP